MASNEIDKLECICTQIQHLYPEYTTPLLHQIKTEKSKNPQITFQEFVQLSDIQQGQQDGYTLTALFYFLRELIHTTHNDDVCTQTRYLLDKIVHNIEWEPELCMSKLIYWIDELLLILKSIPVLRKSPFFNPCILQLVDLANHLQIFNYKNMNHIYLKKSLDTLPGTISQLIYLNNHAVYTQYPLFTHQCNLILMGLSCLTDTPEDEVMWITM